MKIRAATLHDAPALTALMRALAAEHPDHWRWQPGLSWPVHIAEVGGTVVGWVAIMACESFVYVLGLYVAKPRRRHGVGRALVEHVIATAKADNIVEVRLHVHEDNLPARALYQSAGFVQTAHYWSRATKPSTTAAARP
jgi:ribosomal protein S18 acetylase RimI-like enzyme